MTVIASAAVDLNSGVHTGFNASATETGTDAAGNTSGFHIAWNAVRGSGTAHHDNSDVTCQVTVYYLNEAADTWISAGTFGATNYNLTPAGTTGTAFWDHATDITIPHRSDGTQSIYIHLFASIPGAGSGSNDSPLTVLTPIPRGIWMNDSGTWHRYLVFEKASGSWHQCTVFERASGSWHQIGG